MTRFSLLVNDTAAGPPGQDPAVNGTWRSHTIPNVLVRRGDRLTVTLATDGDSAKLDYVDFKRR